MTNEISAQHKQALELHNKILVSAQLVQNNLWEMCSGLKQMRDGKLYKELGYQNFEDYCSAEFNMGARNARYYISIIENISEEKRKTFSAFGTSKLMLLSTLSEPEQEKITEENDVESMTVRELEAQIKELKEKNSALKLDLDELTEEHERACEQVNADSKTITGLRQSISSLNETIEELESRPIEVAVAEPSEDVRRLKETIKSLERTTEEQIERMENEHIEDVRKLHRQHSEELKEALSAQQLDYDEQIEALERQKAEIERRLTEASGSSESADDKQVFKAYFTAAYDAFNRMTGFAGKSENKEFFREKISKLIESFREATERI